MKNGRATKAAHRITKKSGKPRRDRRESASALESDSFISPGERARRERNAKLFREWRCSEPALTREELSSKLGQIMSHTRSVSTIRNWETALRVPRLSDVQACEAIKSGLAERLFSKREVELLRAANAEAA